jgi:hypothetical protein
MQAMTRVNAEQTANDRGRASDEALRCYLKPNPGEPPSLD